jgi:hypothetical protein
MEEKESKSLIAPTLFAFLKQSQTENLKFGHYPREVEEFRSKVSFGQGARARVPWISITATGISTSNGYYPVYLYYREEHALVLAFGLSETFEYAETWPEEITSRFEKIEEVFENPPRDGKSWLFRNYSVTVSGQETRLSLDGKRVTESDLDADLQEILDVYRTCLDKGVKDESSTISKGLFYMEQQLEDFIIENWDSTSLGKQYELIYDEGSLKSQQFITPVGRIDILAKDKVSGSFVVIELKRNQTSDDTVGQVTRYMGWVKKELGDDGVKGVIIAGKYDQRLDYARVMMPELDVFIYEVQFELKEYGQ